MSVHRNIEVNIEEVIKKFLIILRKIQLINEH